MKKYNSNIKLGTTTLNVVNFERQLKFYTEAMGMTIISKNENEATLGTSDNTPLLHLKKSRWASRTFLRTISHSLPSSR